MQGVHNNRKEIEAFIQRHISIKGNCHIWGDLYTGTGYGYMHIGGAAFAVRRVVWWLEHGYLPQGSFMRDTCGQKLCCNPDHLKDLTPEKDRRDSLFRPGKQFNRPRISPEKAAFIWDQLILGNLTTKEAARKCGTSVQTMQKHLKRYESGL